MVPWSFLLVLPYFQCIITPDFCLLMVIQFRVAHYSTSLIAYRSLSLLQPTTAKSSAQARLIKSFSWSFTIRSLNIIKNNDGLNTPPYITPLPILIRSAPIWNLVQLYSHSMELINGLSIWSYLIFRNRMLWSTVSNADFSSMYKDHSLLSDCVLSSLIYLKVLTNLKIFTSQPKPYLKPI